MADGQAREPVHFLAFSASLREGSLNTRLADLAVTTIEANGGDVDRAWMRDFDCPRTTSTARTGTASHPRPRTFIAGWRRATGS